MKLKAELDRVFSLYIRQRGAIDGYNLCVTCGKRFLIKELQCGHYVSRGILATRFDEKNCHPQCMRCNVFLKGNYTEYALYLIRQYGVGFLEELDQKKRQSVKFSQADYKEKIEYYKNKLINLV